MNHASLKSIALFALFSLTLIFSCNNDDDPDTDTPKETGNTKSFNLFSTSTGLISGTVKFAELDDNTTKVEITLSGLNPSGDHPSHIHNNSGAKGGSIAISFENVSGASGKSETIVSVRDDGTAISYNDLINFNGHVNVHESTTNLSLIAQGDIGPNELTPNFEAYDLHGTGGSAISGDVTFVERVSGEILAVIALENTPSGGQHPAHIHLNSIVSGGSISISFNSVNGDTGLSLTDFSELDNGTPISFSQLKDFDGHVKVHLSAADLPTIIAEGDIGANILTGEEAGYDIMELNGSGISGTFKLQQRKSGFTLATITLTGTQADGNHPAHIHANSMENGGGILISLQNVAGSTGLSVTDIKMTDAGTGISYQELLNFNGHVKVHLSPDNLPAVVAGGDIGSNAGGGGARVSYANDIRPILDANCQLAGCHGSDPGIPSWATYATVSANAAMIKTNTGNKTMPPAASGGSLTDEEIQKIAEWVDDGAQNN